MRLLSDPRLPIDTSSDFEKRLIFQLTLVLRDFAAQINSVTEGQIQAITNASTTYPTTGTYQKGDFVRNSTPSESGTAGSKYVVFGWVCTVAGTAGTWVPCRYLTGN